MQAESKILSNTEKEILAFLKEQEILDKYNFQIYLFSPKSELYKIIIPEQTRQNKKSSWMQAGDLLQPLLSLFFLEHFYKQENNHLKLTKLLREEDISKALPKLPFTFTIKENIAITLHHLLSKSSGMRIENTRFYVSLDQDKMDPLDFLKKQLHISQIPGSLYTPNPYVYAYLKELWKSQNSNNAPNSISFQDAFDRYIQKNWLSSFCIGKCKEDLLANLIPPVICIKEHCFSWQTSLQEQFGIKSPTDNLIFPDISSFYTSAYAYATFLKQIIETNSKESSFENKSHKLKRLMAKHLLEPKFSYDPKLGGTSYGFTFHKTSCHSCKQENKMLYRIHSTRSDHTSLAFFTDHSWGAVILINTNQTSLLQEIANKIYVSYGLLDPLPTLDKTLNDLFSPKQEKQTQEIKENTKVQIADWEAWDGFYRPKQTLPYFLSWLNFLHEIRIRVILKDSYIAQVEGLFRKEPMFFLQKIKGEDEIMLARGNVTLNSSRFMAVKNERDKIIQIKSDTLLYNRVPVYLSAWATILYISLLCFSPLFILLFYMIYKPKFKGRIHG